MSISKTLTMLTVFLLSICCSISATEYPYIDITCDSDGPDSRSCFIDSLIQTLNDKPTLKPKPAHFVTATAYESFIYELGRAVDPNSNNVEMTLNFGHASTFLFYDESLNALRILDFKTTNANVGIYPITITITDFGLIDVDESDNHDSYDFDSSDGQHDYWLHPKSTIYNISVVIGQNFLFPADDAPM